MPATTLERARDFVTRDLFVDILFDTEEPIDWLETQLALIERVGLAHHEQSAMPIG